MTGPAPDAADTAASPEIVTPHLEIVRDDPLPTSGESIVETVPLEDGRHRTALYGPGPDGEKSLVAVYETRGDMYDGLFEAFRDGDLLARGRMDIFDHATEGRVSGLDGPYTEYHPRTEAQKAAGAPHGAIALETQYIRGQEYGFRRAYLPDGKLDTEKCGYFTAGRPDERLSLQVRNQIARQQKIDRLIHIAGIEGRHMTEIVGHQVSTARLAVWRAARNPAKPS